ncbi:MAG: hypothetical protein E7667_03580 [Ruminococcaceae bacterium]|nr:hypothetical protein [Oscillospiraceae bacterium]
MKNYLCLNGKKIELTPEQVKSLIGEMKEGGYDVSLDESGEVARIGKYEFIVLRRTKDDVQLLLKGSLGDMRFGENNDFRASDIKHRLDEFADELASIIGAESIVEHTVDLTSDDGLKDYGSTTARVSLLTADMYREHVYMIDKYKLDDWWWLATPFSTPTHGYKMAVKCVAPSGYFNNYNYGNNDFGVRPFCILKSDIFVS